MAPSSEEELIFKIKQPFSNLGDLLNFFESNRQMFSGESFKALVDRVCQLFYKETKKMSLPGQPQFKVLMSDYSNFIYKEYSKFNKFSNKTSFYEGYLPVVSNILSIYCHASSKGSELPKVLGDIYRYMISDYIYMSSINVNEVAKLMFYSINPTIGRISIKVNTGLLPQTLALIDVN